MTELYREDSQLQEYARSLQDKIDREEQKRKIQQHEIKLLGELEKEIWSKLRILENTMSKKKEMKKQFSHQRSISNPEEGTMVALEMKQNIKLTQTIAKSTEEINREFNPQNPAIDSKKILRSSRSYDNRRYNNPTHVPIVPERTKLVESRNQIMHEAQIKRKYNSSKTIIPNRSQMQTERPQTSNGIYTQQITTAVDNNRFAHTNQAHPNPVSKSLSAGIVTKKYGQTDSKRMVTPGSPALYTKKRSENAINPRDMAKWNRNTEQFQGRSTSAFGMYKTNPNCSPLVRVRNEQSCQNRKAHTFVEQGERCQSVENLIEKRPLAKTNSTILNSNDFLIISLESRTVAQQIKLKELEKRYFNEERTLSRSEWTSFVSKFSETQKEVRNLDNEWQELFNELISHNSEYNDHMNQIRMWVTALKNDSKFLQEIMARNLGTPM